MLHRRGGEQATGVHKCLAPAFSMEEPAVRYPARRGLLYSYLGGKTIGAESGKVGSVVVRGAASDTGSGSTGSAGIHGEVVMTYHHSSQATDAPPRLQGGWLPRA